MKKFGKLEKVDLHELWHGGVAEFTPWLSEEENLVEFGKSIGMELQVLKQDQKVGAVHPDILCKDVMTNHFVVIGCQLERTDHTQLGKLIASASGLETVTIIWIARSITEEHCTALTWLNNITGESARFLGVEIEAFKIGDSSFAPDFRLVVKPNGWTCQPKKPVPVQKLTDTELLQLVYWQGLKNFMEANNSFVNLLGTPPKSWFDVEHDSGKYFLTVTVNSQDTSLNIWLNIIGENAKNDFDKLCLIAYKESLTEINQDLKWYKIQDKGGSSVTLKSYASFMEKNDWPNQFTWFKEYLEKFDRFFRPKLKDL
jgi:hypothetical protein